ncbi:SYNPO protein, partial [Chauna torquata]|nr:SYNPO protein [Chauna torquata]
MEEGEGHGTRGTPTEPGHSGEGEQATAEPHREPPADAQQVPLSIYLKENMAPAATNGVHERERAEGEARGLGGTQDGTGLSASAPAPPQSMHIPEQKNGEVPNAPVGTTSTPMGMTSTPVGTASTPVGTTSTPMGTASTPVGMTSVPVGMASVPVGTASAPVETASTPVGTTSTPVGTTSTSVGTASTPVGTTSTPVGMTSVPVGMASAPVEMASAPVGMTSAPMETASAPMGTAPPSGQAQNGARGRQYYEVHLTLAKPKPVKNRTARPFGTQAPTAPSQPPERARAAELPPPP